MAKKDKSLMRQLLDERGIKAVAGVQALVKELTQDRSRDAGARNWKTIPGTASRTTGTRKRTTAETAHTRKP